jgi:hypothetical protein
MVFLMQVLDKELDKYGNGIDKKGRLQAALFIRNSIRVE